MKKLLLNLLALLLLPPGTAFGQKPAAGPQPSASQSFNLTDLQQARLDAARQEIARWQDKMQAALQKFSAICSEAQKENHWPAVQCSLTDLAVTPVLQPSAVSPPPAAKPADK